MIGPRHIISLAGLLVLAGCGSTVQTSQFGSGPVLTAPPAYGPVEQQMPVATPAQQTADARAMTQLTGFVDPVVESQLSQTSRDQAAGAQYNALQFGRPGAPRAWQGDGGASGEVTVGPYVRVNSLDCRDFTHVVTIGGKSSSRQGTACRDAGGTWSVVGNQTG
jgi:surface antigen